MDCIFPLLNLIQTNTRNFIFFAFRHINPFGGGYNDGTLRDRCSVRFICKDLKCGKYIQDFVLVKLLQLRAKKQVFGVLLVDSILVVRLWLWLVWVIFSLNTNPKSANCSINILDSSLKLRAHPDLKPFSLRIEVCVIYFILFGPLLVEAY